MKRQDRPEREPAQAPEPKPGTHAEQAVKRTDDRHPYGAVRPNDKAAEARSRPDRTPAPPVELDRVSRKPPSPAKP